MGLFDISSNLGHVFDWYGTPHASYNGLILPCADIYSLHGGFGNFVFEHLGRKYYDAWLSNYDSKQRFVTHARADMSMIELSILIENNVSFTLQQPFGKIHQKRGQFNIFNSLAMDSKVQFEKGAFYTTLDFHPKIELLNILYADFPELMDPLLNAIAAHREYIFYGRHLYLPYNMVQMVELILDLLAKPVINAFLLDLCVVLLFGFAVSCKLDLTSKGFRYDRKLEIEQRLTGLMQLILSDVKGFRGIDYYAKFVGMSASSLKQNFHSLYGVGMEEFWRKELLKKAFQEVVYTNKTFDEIAIDYGFADGSSFTKAFKKVYKSAPSFFRSVKGGGDE